MIQTGRSFCRCPTHNMRKAKCSIKYKLTHTSLWLKNGVHINGLQRWEALLVLVVRLATITAFWIRTQASFLFRNGRPKQVCLNKLVVPLLESSSCLVLGDRPPQIQGSCFPTPKKIGKYESTTRKLRVLKAPCKVVCAFWTNSCPAKVVDQWKILTPSSYSERSDLLFEGWKPVHVKSDVGVCMISRERSVNRS